MFHFQYQHNELYRKFTDQLDVLPYQVNEVTKIPFLPISFFKSHTVTTTAFNPQKVFESSGTTSTINSKHYVKNAQLYTNSFSKAFKLFYGPEKDWCIVALLPSYMERQNSSLIFMVEELIKKSKHTLSGFYLNNDEKLYQTLLHNEILQQPTLFIGVTYALLDFTEKFSMNLKYTTIMETGGMKGRRKEITRQELHSILKKKLGVNEIHAEYGMTELFSQAYSKGEGLYKCAPWMNVYVRDEDDPLLVKELPQNNKAYTSGIINIIDLANIYSCAFIATDDLGRIFGNRSFEVLGRSDISDIRGCSLLVSHE